MLMLVSPLWSSHTHLPDRYVVLRASASLLTVLEVMALSLSEDTSAGSLQGPQGVGKKWLKIESNMHLAGTEPDLTQGKVIIGTLLQNSSLSEVLHLVLIGYFCRIQECFGMERTLETSSAKLLIPKTTFIFSGIFNCLFL